MSGTWALHVRESAWLDEVERWITAVLGAPVDLVVDRYRPWSVLATVSDGRKRYWFKANNPSMAFEAGLVGQLAKLAPTIVTAPKAVDAARGWMLFYEHGGAIGDYGSPTEADWIGTIRLAARLQQATLGERDALLQLGLPRCSTDTVLDRFDRLVGLMRELPAAHPAHLNATDAIEITQARPNLIQAITMLDDSPYPEALQHGDLHPWNVEATADRLFDFGDAQWACCLEILCVPRDWVAAHGTVTWDLIADAYRNEWSKVGLTVDAESFAAYAAAATLTYAVNRSVTWWNALQHATADAWIEWGAAPRAHLLNVARPA